MEISRNFAILIYMNFVNLVENKSNGDLDKQTSNTFLFMLKNFKI